MKFVIEKIKIEKFRAIESLETELWDKTILLGDNETSKTGFATAILWCLTGKSSDGNNNFEIVPSGMYGKVSPSVELECHIDNKAVTLKREYKAKLARDKSFKEYATVCYINGLEVGARKFQDYISQNICDEKIFKILSNPYTFVENCPKEQKELPWQAQRRILMGMIESVPDSKAVEEIEGMDSLIEPLKRYDDASQYLSYLKQETSKTQKQVSSFEAKMEQQQSNFSDLDYSEEDVSKEIGRLNEKKSEVEAKINERNNAASSREAQKQAEILKSIYEKREMVLRQYNSEATMCEQKKREIMEKAQSAKKKADEYIQRQAIYAKTVEELKATKIRTTCPTCGQTLKASAIEETKKNLVERIKNGLSYIESARKQAEKYMKEYQDICQEVESITFPVYPAKELDEISAEQKEAEDSYKGYKSEVDVSDLKAEMDSIEMSIELERKKLYNIEQNKLCEKRVKELEAAHREEVIRLNELQRLSDLCREFITIKCKKAEDQINSMFHTVKFVLFEQNKSNDEIREVCNLTFNGHKYEDLSASTKLVANMELLEAFHKYHGVYVPIVIDNMESVTADIVSDAQVITTYVKAEPCPVCGGNSGRRGADGKWECQSCHHIWRKKLSISEANT